MGASGASPTSFVRYFRNLQGESSNEVELGIRLAKKLFPDRKVILAGHSYGGLPIVNWLSSASDYRVERILLINPILSNKVDILGTNSAELARLLQLDRTKSDNRQNPCSGSRPADSPPVVFQVVQGTRDFLPRLSNPIIENALKCSHVSTRAVYNLIPDADHNFMLHLDDAASFLDENIK
jgi:pimeloyl-ACP methyl ester carboxylesterase